MFPDIYEVKQKILGYENRLKISLVKKVELMRMKYEKCMASSVFKEPTRKIQEQYLIIDQNIKKLENFIKTKYEKDKTKYIEIIAKLDAYSPLKTLARGYTITEKNGKIVKKVEELKTGDKITIKLVDGKKNAIIRD